MNQQLLDQATAIKYGTPFVLDEYVSDVEVVHWHANPWILHIGAPWTCLVKGAFPRLSAVQLLRVTYFKPDDSQETALVRAPRTFLRELRSSRGPGNETFVKLGEGLNTHYEKVHL